MPTVQGVQLVVSGLQRVPGCYLLSNGNRTVAAWNPIIKSCISVKVVLEAWCTPFGSHSPIIFKRHVYANFCVLKKCIFINMLMYFKVYVTINIS